MRLLVVSSLVVHLIACRSGGQIVDPPPPDPPPPPPPQASACQPNGSACFKKAEQRSDADPVDAEAQLRHCFMCRDAPPAAYRLMATLLSDRGKQEEARQTLQLGVRRFPSSVALHQALGRSSLRVGRHQEAIASLGRAHRLRPNDRDLETEYQGALARHGTQEDRLEAELMPLLLEATGRYELGDSDGALRALNDALSKAKGVPRLEAQVRHRLGTVFLGGGRIDQAKSHLSSALQLETRPSALRAEVLVSYAEVMLSESLLDEAAKAAEEAVSIEPKNPLAHANLAIARALAGQAERAIAAFEQAFESGLARRLTLGEFLALGPPIDKVKDHPAFEPLIKKAYPGSSYP